MIGLRKFWPYLIILLTIVHFDISQAMEEDADPVIVSTSMPQHQVSVSDLTFPFMHLPYDLQKVILHIDKDPNVRLVSRHFRYLSAFWLKTKFENSDKFIDEFNAFYHRVKNASAYQSIKLLNFLRLPTDPKLAEDSLTYFNQTPLKLQLNRTNFVTLLIHAAREIPYTKRVIDLTIHFVFEDMNTTSYQNLNTQSLAMLPASFPQLTALRVNLIPDTLAAVPDIYLKLPRLKTLEIIKMPVDNAIDLKNHPALTRLKLHVVRDTDFMILAQLSNLKHLEIGSTKFLNLDNIKLLKNLKTLKLHKIYQQDLNVLQKLSQLKKLELHVENISTNKTFNNNWLSALTKLEILSFKNFYLPVEDVLLFGKLPHLKKLILIDDKIYDYGPIRALPSHIQVICRNNW